MEQSGVAARLRRAAEAPLVGFSFALFASIVLGVIITMSHDVRWLLALAWPCVVLAMWEFMRLLSANKKWRQTSTFSGALISGAGLLWLYLNLAPKPEPFPPSALPNELAAIQEHSVPVPATLGTIAQPTTPSAPLVPELQPQRIGRKGFVFRGGSHGTISNLYCGAGTSTCVENNGSDVNASGVIYDPEGALRQNTTGPQAVIRLVPGMPEPPRGK